MKTLKTYGVKGLMEWQCQIVSGNVRFLFAFTDGVITAHGMSPAKFKTDNPVFQSVIENSNYFKKGRIALLKTVVLEADKPKVEEVAEKVEVKTISVSCLDDAKQILCDEYNVPATSLTGKRSIVSAAKERNIVFEGI